MNSERPQLLSVCGLNLVDLWFFLPFFWLSGWPRPLDLGCAQTANGVSKNPLGRYGGETRLGGEVRRGGRAIAQDVDTGCCPDGPTSLVRYPPKKPAGQQAAGGCWCR